MGLICLILIKFIYIQDVNNITNSTYRIDWLNIILNKSTLQLPELLYDAEDMILSQALLWVCRLEQKKINSKQKENINRVDFLINNGFFNSVTKIVASSLKIYLFSKAELEFLVNEQKRLTQYLIDANKKAENRSLFIDNEIDLEKGLFNSKNQKQAEAVMEKAMQAIAAFQDGHLYLYSIYFQKITYSPVYFTYSSAYFTYSSVYFFPKTILTYYHLSGSNGFYLVHLFFILFVHHLICLHRNLSIKIIIS